MGATDMRDSSLASVVCLRMALRSPLPLGRTSKAMWDLPVSNNCSMSYLKQGNPCCHNNSCTRNPRYFDTSQEEAESRLCDTCTPKQL